MRKKQKEEKVKRGQFLRFFQIIKKREREKERKTVDLERFETIRR